MRSTLIGGGERADAGAPSTATNPRRVLIPIGEAQIDPEQRPILAEGLHADARAGLPETAASSVGREAEAGLRQRFGRA